MSLRGRINQQVLDWRFEHAMRRFERQQAKAARAVQDPHWTWLDTLLNFAAFCCLVTGAAGLAFMALCYITAQYPEAVYIAFKTVGIN